MKEQVSLKIKILATICAIATYALMFFVVTNIDSWLGIEENSSTEVTFEQPQQKTDNESVVNKDPIVSVKEYVKTQSGDTTFSVKYITTSEHTFKTYLSVFENKHQIETLLHDSFLSSVDEINLDVVQNESRYDFYVSVPVMRGEQDYDKISFGTYDGTRVNIIKTLIAHGQNYSSKNHTGYFYTFFKAYDSNSTLKYEDESFKFQFGYFVPYMIRYEETFTLSCVFNDEFKGILKQQLREEYKIVKKINSTKTTGTLEQAITNKLSEFDDWLK